LFLNKKGQVFSWDMLIAISVFIFILVASITMWDFYRAKSEIIDLRADMEFAAQNAMVGLITTSGDPGNWYVSPSFEVSSLGLVSGRDYVLDGDKVDKLVEWNATYYEEIKSSLGVRKYDMYLSFLNQTGEIYGFGIDSPSNAEAVVRIERVCMIDDDVFKVVMEVWDG
jgi:hypothetical protein